MGTPSNSRDLGRLAAWVLVALAGGAALLAWLAREATADLARGRERLLAADTSAAAAAFGRARRWPPVADAARAGERVAAGPAGRAMEGAVPLVQLQALDIEALILTAIESGRLDAAASLATLARAAQHPLGDLYAAALAFDAGDERGARSLAASSPTPLDARGVGTRLRRALEAKDSGAGVARLVLDRRGQLAATVRDADQVVATAESAPLLAGSLERLGPLPGGRALRLTVDLDLSRLAVAALGEERGAIVIVETATGAVLTAVSDARTAAVERAAAFEQRREPASIAKILTAAAAYRHGIDADEETKRVTCTGVERYGGRLLWCPASAGPLAGLDHALAMSCNVAFANLGVRLGAERLVEEFQRWGFDGESDSLLGAAGRIHTPPRDDRDIADLAIGLELADVTPLHAALLAAAVANDGRMPAPALIRGACSPLGLTDTPHPLSEARPVLDPAIARRLRAAMEVVARSGTGTGLAPPGLRMAMKTGTAAEWRLGYHVNYIGMLPLPEPSLAFCVRVTNGTSSPAVTTAAREVTRRLLAGLAAQPHLMRDVR